MICNVDTETFKQGNDIYIYIYIYISLIIYIYIHNVANNRCITVVKNVQNKFVNSNQ